MSAYVDLVKSLGVRKRKSRSEIDTTLSDDAYGSVNTDHF